MYPDVDTLLPAHGDGWTTYHRGPHGENQWGTEQTIARILKLAYYWRLNHPHHQLQIGHISKRWGGSFPPHTQHTRGIDVDFRAMRDDGLALPVRTYEQAYSAPLTDDFLQLLHKVGKPTLVLFSSPTALEKGLSRLGTNGTWHIHARFT